MNLSQEDYNFCVYLARAIYTKYYEKLTPTHSISRLSGLRLDIFEFEEVNFVVFSGTNGFFAFNDWLCNIKMALGIKPKQFIQALEVVSSELDQNKTTIFVGHSLGGALLEYVCNHIKHDNFMGVVFNGAGVRHLVEPKYENNIYHFITTRDILNRAFLTWYPFKWFKRYFKHIGEIHYVEDNTFSMIKSHSNFYAFEKVIIKK